MAVGKRSVRAAAGSPVRLRGTPRRLAGPLPAAAGADAVEVDVAGVEVESISVRAIGDPGGTGRAWLRLALPASTRPGEYQGTIRVGRRKAQQVVLDVEPRARLRLSPRRLLLRGGAGERVVATVLAVNLGNTECAFRGTDAVGLFEVDGAERAIGRTFRRGRDDGQRIVERLAEELAQGYGGLAKLTVAGRAGTLGPGETRELAVTLHLPDALRPGRVYEGAWTLPDANYMVQVEVSGGTSSEEEAR